jgi:hypothetical protein
VGGGHSVISVHPRTCRVGWEHFGGFRAASEWSGLARVCKMWCVCGACGVCDEREEGGVGGYDHSSNTRFANTSFEVDRMTRGGRIVYAALVTAAAAPSSVRLPASVRAIRSRQLPLPPLPPQMPEHRRRYPGVRRRNDILLVGLRFFFTCRANGTSCPASPLSLAY